MNLPSYRCLRNALEAMNRAAGSWRRLAICALLGATLLAAGCQSSPMAVFPDPHVLAGQATNSAAMAPAITDARTANYNTNLLQEGDVVSINFQYATNFNAVQKIALDGVINMESVGPVKAAGRTVMELQTDLAKLYKPQIKDDVVTVKIINSANGVYITGAVVRPGRLPMERPMTAMEAIMEAGGFDPNRAKLNQVIVMRIEDGKQRTYRLNLKRALKGLDDKPFYLKPFDIVHVPTKTFNF